MGVDTQHPSYGEWLPKWQRCRDAAGGEDAVKKRGRTYLPRPSGQSDEEYEAYKTRAYWFNATQRTVDGLTGLIFRKEPQIETPEALQEWLDDITLTGVSARELAAQLIEEVVVVGRGGILVDFPSVALSPDLTVRQVEESGVRPYLAMYAAEDIVNWRTGRIGAKTQLVLVVLRETNVGASVDDEFKQETADQYRVLDLTPAGYRQRVFRKTKDGWQPVGEPIVPVIRGKPFDYVPFFFAGVSRSDGKVEQPPIYDLANVNVSHYRTMADLEHGAHWTGLPTPILIGLSEDKKEIALGSTQATVLPLGGDAKFLEFSGQGLAALEKRAEVKESEMAVLGARILAPEKRQVEAAETASIHRAGENSVLASIANTASRVLTKALELARDWGGLSGEVSLKLNTDYLAVQMSPQMLVALTGALQAGHISHPDYFALLQRGDVIDSTRTFEEMMADIEANPPIAATRTVPDQGDGDAEA